MAGPPNAENIVASGLRGTVEYAVRKNGRKEAEEWLDSQPDNIRARFDVLFNQVVMEGYPFPNEKQLKKLSNDVYEFRRGGDRLFCVKYGRRWLLTHHYEKGHSKKHQSRAADHAYEIANEHLERERQIINRSNQ